MPFAGHLRYEQQGTGLPVLFVHGWCMSSAVWELQRECIAKKYRYIALDLHGHGRSSSLTGMDAGFQGYAADILHLIEHLDLQQLVVVGWSMGAQAVLKAYHRLQDRLAGLVLVGATPRFTAADHFPFGLPPKEAEGMRVKLRRNLDLALTGFQHNLFADRELDDPAVARQVETALERVVMPTAPAALAGLEALMDEEVLDDVHRIFCPTLLIHGLQDRICLPQASAWLEQAIPGSRRIVYPECAHAPFLSRNLQFNNDLIHFVGACHARD